MRMLFIVFALVGLIGCSSFPDSGGDQPVVDPIVTWSAVTKDCTGATFTGTVTYNVYAVSGQGPVPVVSEGSGEIPCGVVSVADRTKVQPLNSTPITALTYRAMVADGVWTFAVETLGPNGAPSALSSQVTKSVKNRTTSAQDVGVGP